MVRSYYRLTLCTGKLFANPFPIAPRSRLHLASEPSSAVRLVCLQSRLATSGVRTRTFQLGSVAIMPRAKAGSTAGKKSTERDPGRFYCPFPGCKRSFAELWRLKASGHRAGNPALECAVGYSCVPGPQTDKQQVADGCEAPDLRMADWVSRDPLENASHYLAVAAS